MEDNISPVRKLSFQKKKPKKNNNSTKNNIELYSAIEDKDLNDSELEEKQFPNQVKKKKKAKFKSNDNISLFLDNNKDKNYKMDAASSPRKNKKILKKNEYYIGCEEYLEKLYEDEPHFKKSVFKKKSNNKFIRNFNRKVSFISPKNNKTKQNINLIKLNKNITINNKIENNNSKSKVIKEDDEKGDEQSYGYDKKYNASLLKEESNNNLIKTAIHSKKDFEGRNIKRRQTNKTCKSNNNNALKIRNFEKRNTTNINFKRDIKDIRKKVSSKSNEKKFKKKKGKIIKDNKNCKDKNNIPKVININNNININADEKQKNEKNKQKKCITIVENNDKKNENIQKSNNSESKNKKRQDLSPKKSTENVETLVNVVENNNKKNKNKNLFCCIPFLKCLKGSEEKKIINN